MIKNFALAGLLFVLIGCSQSHSPAARLDPLINQIYKQGEFRNQTQLFKALDQAEVVFLGEHHDNLKHHKIQLTLLKRMVEQGKKPIIAIEVFSKNQTASLMQYLQGPPKRAAIYLKQIAQESRMEGRPEWVGYRQILEFAKSNDLQVAGLDIERSLKRRLTQHPRSELTEFEQEAIPETETASPAYRAAMEKRFTQGHCGWSNPQLLSGLMRVWQTRNQVMGAGISKLHQPARPVVVLLGAGHIEFNLAVVQQFKKHHPLAKIFSLAMIEVGLVPAQPQEYFLGTPEETEQFGPSFDWGWFTERSSWIDPCVRFKAQLQHHSKKER